jgi:hypothetical protein
VPTQWLEARWLFNGTHAGCVERRSRFYASMAHLHTCEFDGRLSLVRFGHRLLLYARTNPATHGQRYVQMTASDDGGRTWGRFSFISIGEYDYAHPVFDAAAIAAQSRVPMLQGCANTWFCGAWTRYGFHEDGLASGLAVIDGWRERWAPDLASPSAPELSTAVAA